MFKGTLYLIPTPIGNAAPQLEMSAAALNALINAEYIIAEEIRTARRLIAKLPGHKPIDALHFQEMGKHSGMDDAIEFLQYATKGHDIVMISEAGSPCVADPGGIIVAAAHRIGLKVKPLSGPSSIIQALMASGLNGQQFTFAGYLPIAAAERKDAIRRLEKVMLSQGQTQIFIETPFRNNQLLAILTETCQPTTLLCIAVGIGSADEAIRTFPVEWWKKNEVQLSKMPAVFLLGKSLMANQ